MMACDSQVTKIYLLSHEWHVYYMHLLDHIYIFILYTKVARHFIFTGSLNLFIIRGRAKGVSLKQIIYLNAWLPLMLYAYHPRYINKLSSNGKKEYFFINVQVHKGQQFYTHGKPRSENTTFITLSSAKLKIRRSSSFSWQKQCVQRSFMLWSQAL